jgi:stage II sporulation protein M
MTALLLMGIIFGAIVVNSLPYGTKNELMHYLEQFFSELSGGQIAGPGLIFKEGLINDAQYLGLIWMLGLSVIGLPVIFILIFVKGLVLGFTIGFLIGQSGLKGFFIVMVGVFPQNLVLIPGHLFISVAAVICSLKIIRQLLVRTRREPLFPQFAGYLLVLLLALAVVAVASGYEAFISPALIHYLVH